jgi:predicted dehydrogenase
MCTILGNFSQTNRKPEKTNIDNSSCPALHRWSESLAQDTMAPVSVGLLGAGTFAREGHRPALQRLISSGDLVVTAIWSRSVESAAALAQLYKRHTVPDTFSGESGIEKVLGRQDINAVILTVPIPFLIPIALRALKAGKHVLAEKPLGPDAEAAYQALVEYALMEEHGAPLYCVAENFRTETGIARMRDIVQSGGLGAIVGVELVAHVCMKEGSKYARGWRMQEDKHGFIAGQLLDGGVHYIAGLRCVVGSDVSRVTARLQKLTSHLPVADTAHALLEFENGVVGTAVITYSSSVFRWEMTVVGREGRVTLSRAQVDGQHGYMLRTTLGGGDHGKEEFLTFNGVDQEMRVFIDSCASGTPDERLTARTAFNDVATIQAFVDSSACHTPVVVRAPPVSPSSLSSGLSHAQSPVLAGGIARA